MNVLYIGAGFVGTTSAAVSADSGHKTLVYDIDKQKIDKLNSFNYEKINSCLSENGLAELLIRNKNRIKFTADFQDVVEFLNEIEVIFLCLPTPEIGETGESDLTYYWQAVRNLSQALKQRNEQQQTQYVVIVNKSTVPIETIKDLQEFLVNSQVKNFGLVANPEFLVEGQAVKGSLHPNRVVVGAWQEKDFLIMRQLYQRFYQSDNVKYIEVNPLEAASGKLLANYVLFNKLAVCFDVIGRTCELFSGLKFENVKNILISDPRIGSWGFYDSLYAGGSCFIKDARSLAYQLKQKYNPAVLVNETYLANKRQLNNFLNRAEKDLNWSWKDKVISIFGLAFKQGTNDVRNSPSLEIVKFLQDKEVKKINLYDPVANDSFAKHFPENEMIKYFQEINFELLTVDLIIISTDWPEFKELYTLLLKLDKPIIIMDGRRMLAPFYEDLQKRGFKIISVGGPTLS